MSLYGKVALVTGAAQGLGKAFSEVLLRRGAKVCVADIKVQEGEATAAELRQEFGRDRAFFLKCDVACESDLEDTFRTVQEQCGRLDVVVNNAGISGESQWSKMIDINLKGVIKGTQLAIEAMRKDNGGHGGIIVNISSSAGLIPVAPIPAYVASKYGVVGYTRSWAENPYQRAMGVSFTCMCPSYTDTAIIKREGSEEDLPFRKESIKLMDDVGIQPISNVVNAFEQLLDTPENNGVIVTVALKKGVKIRRPRMSSRL